MNFIFKTKKKFVASYFLFFFDFKYIFIQGNFKFEHFLKTFLKKIYFLFILRIFDKN